MTVHVVTDSSSCLPADMAAAAGVTVLDLHLSEEDGEISTAGLGQLELTAAYARLLERGSDAGVVAIHLSKELSVTWSNAKAAAGIFDNSVRVLDTGMAGMVLGFAALSAAAAAQDGADVDEVEAVAQQAIEQASLWLYVSKVDALRKGGRLSAGQALLSAALAARPIFQMVDGKIVAVSKARTQSKAIDRLLMLVLEQMIPGATEAVKAAVAQAKEAHHEDVKSRQRSKTKAKLDELVNRKKAEEAGEDPAPEWDAAAALSQRTHAAMVNALVELVDQPRTVRIAFHTSGDQDVAEDLQEKIESLTNEIHAAKPGFTVECVQVELSAVIAAHTGTGALGVALSTGE